ncbi:MAG: hypothetical protein MI861_20430, partial [Pirellulales bacterium]|nr:hypothetical protein [Pirellulales bacterium]
LASSASALATSHPSPWASYQSDTAGAHSVRTTALTGAAQSWAITQAGAQKNLEVAHNNAETAWHLDNITLTGTQAEALPGADQTLATELSASYAASAGVGNGVPVLDTAANLDDLYDHSHDELQAAWNVANQSRQGNVINGAALSDPQLSGSTFFAYPFIDANHVLQNGRLFDSPTGGVSFWQIDTSENQWALYDYELELRYETFTTGLAVDPTLPTGAITASYTDPATGQPSTHVRTFDGAAFDQAAQTGGTTAASNQNREGFVDVNDGTNYRQQEIEEIQSALDDLQSKRVAPARSALPQRPSFLDVINPKRYTPPAGEVIVHSSQHPQGLPLSAHQELRLLSPDGRAFSTITRFTLTDDTSSLQAVGDLVFNDAGSETWTTEQFSAVFDRLLEAFVLTVDNQYLSPLAMATRALLEDPPPPLPETAEIDRTGLPPLPDFNDLDEGVIEQLLQWHRERGTLTTLSAHNGRYTTFTGYVVPFTLRSGETFQAVIKHTRLQPVVGYGPVAPFERYSLAGVSPVEHNPRAAAEFFVTDEARLENLNRGKVGLEFALHVLPGGAAADYARLGEGKQALISGIADLGLGLGAIAKVGRLGIKASRYATAGAVALEGSVGIYRSAEGILLMSQGQGGSAQLAEGLLLLFGAKVTLINSAPLPKRGSTYFAENFSETLGAWSRAKGYVPGTV